LFDPTRDVTLSTLQRAAALVGRKVQIELVLPALRPLALKQDWEERQHSDAETQQSRTARATQSDRLDDIHAQLKS
jgi:Flp pilus assembly protein CpaB